MKSGKQKQGRKRIMIDAIVVAILLIAVFFASSQPYEKQDLRGTIRQYLNMKQVKEHFGTVSFIYGKKEISVKTAGPDGFVEFFVRKGAHFLTFATMGVVFYRLFRYWSRPREALGWAGFLVTLAAVLDEWHQSFTPNRTSMITDVILDISGLLCAMIFITLFQLFKR